MRKITGSAIDAFKHSYPFNSGNTKVIVDDTTRLYLFGNLIAEKIENRLFITNAGYFTNTTKERLNALPNVGISQKKGKWYLNGKVWDGKRIQIK